MKGGGSMRFLGSLRLAVPLLVTMAVVLAWGTIYETRFGTAAVQRFIYQAWWFQGLLAFLALNLAAAALQRRPWQRAHAPFLLAHLGIILILIGGIIGGRWGLEGHLVIPEGQAERMLQLPHKVLVVSQPNPGVPHILPTQFEATAWRQEPHALFQVPLEDRDVTLVVDRYYPDAVVDEQVTADGAEESPAAQILLSHEGQEEAIWLLAQDPERFGARWGQAHVLFLEPSDPAQLSALLGAMPLERWSRGVVTVALPAQGLRQDIPVPETVGAPVPIEGSPYQVTFKEYFTDFVITESGVANRSGALENPAVALTITGPEGTDAFLAFALHPDFPAIHERRHIIPARVTYRHPALEAALPPEALCLVRHPSGALSCVLTGDAGQRHAAPCEIGRRYTHPWLGYQFEVREVYPRARVAQRFINRSGEVRAEALHVVAQEGQETAEAWVRLRGRAELSLGREPVVVEYRPAARELPLTLKLLDFRKVDYPGTQMAASFESDVELTDAKRGLVLIRTIRMNSPLRYRGFSFYQSSYLEGPTETTVLSVRNDPGTPFVYAGFLTVILGVILMFASRRPSERPADERGGGREG